MLLTATWWFLARLDALKQIFLISPYFSYFFLHLESIQGYKAAPFTSLFFSPLLVYNFPHCSRCSQSVSNSWQTVANHVKSTLYTVRGLRPNTIYLFMVRAINSQGLSDPSPMSDPVRTQGKGQGRGLCAWAEIERRNCGLTDGLVLAVWL